MLLRGGAFPISQPLSSAGGCVISATLSHTGPGWGTALSDWGQPTSTDTLLR